MTTKSILILTIGIAVSWIPNALGQEPVQAKADHLPNIVLIMADDLGYGEIGYYGQAAMQTPRIDEMAAQGMAFSQFYAGATVCAASRCTLMTGRHNGHASVRGNATRENSLAQSLRPEDYTLAEMLKERGYDTACIGKWGLGELGEPGHPMDQGFNHFFGYLNQVHAHNYFPGYLYYDRDVMTLRNEVELADPERGDVGGGYATKKLEYSHDLFIDKSVEFMTRPRSSPFFLYLALTLPHANNEANRMTGDGAEVPDWSMYADKPWSQASKQHAAMVSYLDTGVGRVLDQLQRLSIQENTIVIFTSDNGPHNESDGRDLALLKPSGDLRGMKRSLYEGGIRVPTICYWPGHIDAASVSGHIGFSGDFFQTLADLTGGPCTIQDGPIDSISLVPTLIPDKYGDQKEHEYLYFEFYEQGTRQAVQFGKWKAIRQPMLTGKVELYDLTTDIGEKKNVAADFPDVVQQAIGYMTDARAPSDRWPVPSSGAQ